MERQQPTLECIMLMPLGTGISAAAGAAAVVSAMAGVFAYGAMVPSSQFFGHTLIAPRNKPGGPGELALTFDDGPNPACTPRLLDVLAAHNLRATFFMIGSFAEREPALVRRVHDAGHLIGDHSWSHPNLALTAAARVAEELTRTRDLLQQITGAPIGFFRPPYGARRPYVLKAARGLGMIPVTWNAMTNDWAEPDADAIAARLMGLVDRLEQRGWAANIVLHDGGHRGLGANRNPSVSAAGQLLARYAASHRFVTLDAWQSAYPAATA
jgi:peptidoglycan/xylan/chitin deacetylase (PgdA/CDA1 family)